MIRTHSAFHFPSQTCNQWDDGVFPGTALANCSFLAQDIKACQAAGKLVTLSLGGGTGQVGFSSDSQAESFADQIWDLFLGGASDIRPFGDAVLDGCVSRRLCHSPMSRVPALHLI